MTTANWASPVEHTSDGTFRAWGAELSANLVAAGLVQTADTGQINWATAARPTATNVAGYQIFRFNDALQATAPIFIKLEYGTAGTTLVPGIYITVSTGSNGAGMLNGAVESTRRGCCSSSTVITSSYTEPRASYAAHAEGVAWLSFKQGVSGSGNIYGLGAFAVMRTVDNTGAPTGVGFAVYTELTGVINSSSSWSVQAIRTAAPALVFPVDTAGQVSFNPHGRSTTVVDADKQVFGHWTVTPRVSPVVGSVCYLNSELAVGSQFSAAPVGTTARNYMCVGAQHGAIGSSASTLGFAFIWE